MSSVIDPVSYINERTYLDSLHNVLAYDGGRGDRTGTGTSSEFGTREVYDISNGRIPLLSTKLVHFPSIAHELIWMLKGDPSIKYLKDNKVRIWDNWIVSGSEVRDEDGNLTDGISSSIYGESWRNIDDTRVLTPNEYSSLPKFDVEGFELPVWAELGSLGDRTIVTRKIDQIARVIWQLKNTPGSRRILFNAYNPSRVADVVLPPCHLMAQFYVKDGLVDCQVYLRSNDVFLGKPFNLPQYAALTHILAKYAGLKANRLIFITGDMHLYDNHREAAREQLSREIVKHNAPKLELNIDVNLDPSFITIDQMVIEGYHHLESIRAPIAT